MGYLHGTITEPETSDPNFESWEAENSLIMSQLLNSMQPEMAKPFLFLSTAKEIWDALTHTYSKQGDAAQVFELMNKIQVTKQGELTVTTYYNTLKVLQHEVDIYQHIAKIADLLKRQRIFEFFTGLNLELDQVRSRILGKVLIPSLNEVCFPCA